MSEIILGLFAPFVTVVFLTRVTYNHYVSSLLTLIIITAIHMKYYEPTYVILLWGVSLATGFFAGSFMVKQLKKK